MRFLLPLSLALTSAAQAAAPFPAPMQTLNHPGARSAVHVDGQRTLAVDDDGATAVLVPRQGPARAVTFPGNGKLRSPTVTPEGRTLAVQLAFDECQVVVWDVTAGRQVAAVQGDFTHIFGCDRPEGGEFNFDTHFTPDGRFLLTRDDSGLRRWDARTGKLLRTQPGKFESLHLSPDGRTLAALGAGRRVELWASDLGRRLKVTPRQPADCFRTMGAGVNWSADRTKLAFSCDREVRVWNVAAGGLRSYPRMDRREYPDTPMFSPDGQFVLANERQFGVAVWNVGSGRRVAHLKTPGPSVQVTDVEVTPNNLLFAALDDGRILRANLQQPAQVLEPLRPFPDKARLWPSLAVSREGNRLAVASGDGRLNVYALPGN
ncbi:WD40 repeat protein [Deinococcus sp. HSC-46F16]|uniref:WD40 repeat domain-containing protein n=1 Tax=Deinococcus sp. HSC-46F16 TaxID=2910968 RepID=UPI00209D5A18|nr:WD40 repeat domain-containing protein [Deinococcus sp. HSC-46F16]MCP2013207.1 WD40 repeat protein [Deinococcus sp. HSC-46F16]